MSRRLGAWSAVVAWLLGCAGAQPPPARAEAPGAGVVGLEAATLPPPDPAAIRKALLGDHAGLRGCVRDALREAPGLQVGIVHVRTIIQPWGRVDVLGIDKPEVEQSPLGACLKARLEGISVPAFSGGPVEVVIPMKVTN